jgi:hypothetical protein
LTVEPLGLNGSNNRAWAVNIAQDVVPGSMAAELAFAIDGTDLLDVVVGDPTIWDTPNPGNNPYTGTETEGIYIDYVNDRSFSAYGSAIVTSTVPTQFLKITTAGAGLTTVRYGTAASGSTTLGARIASHGENFDGYTGAVTAVPEPATLALLSSTAFACVLSMVRRRRVA